VVERPETLTAADVIAEPDVEVRRAMIDRIGAERFLSELNACPVSRDRYGTLYRIELADDEPLTLVEVVNGTPEPDGTPKHYFLRVPPNVKTARAAVAWTYDVPTKEYAPKVRK
jgi:hypothetical protein